MPSFRAADGEQLSYWDIGRGPVCVMVHGFGMPAFLWLPFVLPLASRHRFILPNLRGFGSAHDAPVRHDSIFTQYAHDLHGLMEHLQLDKPSLVGFSMGGCTAMEYQRLYGFDNIGSYLQVDQGLHVGHTEQGEDGLFGEAQERWMDILSSLIQDMQALGVDKPFDALPKQQRQRLWKMFSEFSGSAFHHPLMKLMTRMAQNERVIRMVAPTSNWPVYLHCMRGFVEHRPDFRSSMSDIAGHIPVWFFVGNESLLYPPQAQLKAAEQIPHARVVRFRKAGHGVMFDSPLRFVRKLDEFLAHSARRRRRAKLAHKAASSVMAAEAMHV